MASVTCALVFPGLISRTAASAAACAAARTSARGPVTGAGAAPASPTTTVSATMAM